MRACVCMHGMRDPSFEINFDKFFILLFLSRLDRSNLAKFLVERSYCVGLYFHSIENGRESRKRGAKWRGLNSLTRYEAAERKPADSINVSVLMLRRQLTHGR